MLYKIALIFYYLVIAKLPNSRYLPIVNRIRVGYISKILGIIKVSTGCIVEEGVYFSNGKSKVKLGAYTQINENVFIQSAQIGNYVLIAPNVSIISQNHIYEDISEPILNQGASENLPVIICDNVWIGRNATILPGCIIGSGAIIGAGAVVTKNVPANAIVGGVPARIIRSRMDMRRHNEL